MMFEERFELGSLLRDDGIQTFAAEDKAGGPSLLAHFLANPAESRDLLAALDRLPERERQRIVDRGERSGIAYVVTGNLPGYSGFREWLQENGRAPRPLDAAGAWKVILPEGNVDEQFLALFPTGERVQANPEPSLPATPPRHATVEPMGEFTRMFQTVPATPPAPPAPPVAPPPPPSPSGPGEFTRMFQAAQPSPTAPEAPPAAPPKPTDRPGEFTRFFEAQVHESKAPMQPFSQPLPPPAASPKQGEFTRVFGRGEIRANPQEPVGYTAAPPPPAPPSPVPAPPPAAPPRLFDAIPPSADPAAAQGPGDFTRQFSAVPSLTLGQSRETPAPGHASLPQATAPPAQGPSATGSRWPLILGVGAIVMMVAVVILFFVSRVK